MTLEAKMARLDDAGVDRTNRDFVDLFAFHAEEVGDADDRSLARLAVPRIVAGAVRRVKPHRLEPGMPLRTYPVLLGNFALEEMHLQTIRRQGREALGVHCCDADA